MDVISDCSGMGFRLRRSDPEWEEKVSELQVIVRSGCRPDGGTVIGWSPAPRKEARCLTTSRGGDGVFADGRLGWQSVPEAHRLGAWDRSDGNAIHAAS